MFNFRVLPNPNGTISTMAYLYEPEQPIPAWFDDVVAVVHFYVNENNPFSRHPAVSISCDIMDHCKVVRRSESFFVPGLAPRVYDGTAEEVDAQRAARRSGGKVAMAKGGEGDGYTGLGDLPMDEQELADWPLDPLLALDNQIATEQGGAACAK